MLKNFNYSLLGTETYFP